MRIAAAAIIGVVVGAALGAGLTYYIAQRPVMSKGRVVANLELAVRKNDQGSTLERVACVELHRKVYRCVGDYVPSERELLFEHSDDPGFVDVSPQRIAQLRQEASGVVGFDVDVDSDGALVYERRP